MTQQEFENLTGMVVEPAIFERAERIYINAGNLTKAQVCDEIKQHPWLLESEAVKELAEMAEEQSQLAKRRLADTENLKSAFLNCCIQLDEEATWAKAKDLIGEASVIIYKIDHDADLSRADCAYIRENLR